MDSDPVFMYAAGLESSKIRPEDRNRHLLLWILGRRLYHEAFGISVYTGSNCKMIDEWRIGKDVEGSGPCLNISPRHSPRGHEVFRWRFEPDICRMQVRSFIESAIMLSDIAVEWLLLLFRVWKNLSWIQARRPELISEFTVFLSPLQVSPRILFQYGSQPFHSTLLQIRYLKSLPHPMLYNSCSWENIVKQETNVEALDRYWMM